jgi:hypothetical protein
VAAPPPDLRTQVAAFVSERFGGSPAAPPAAEAVRPPAEAVDFVAEDDVRRALRENRTIALKPGAIVTPSARDLAEGRNVLIPADAS